MTDAIASLLMKIYPNRELVTATLLEASTIEPIGIADREQAVMTLMFLKVIEKRPVFLVSNDALMLSLKPKMPILSIEEAHTMMKKIESDITSPT